jgi:3-oxoacyl-[acyl-carrier protein] reductase
MSVSIDLTGRIALITGASRGIGAAIACRLHEAGAGVILNHPGEATRAEAEAVADRLNAVRPDSAAVHAADVSDADAVRAMMQSIAAARGGLDILVNNAGILRDRTVAKMSLEEWQSVLDVNLSGVFHGCKFGLEILREEGAIVNIGSLSARAGFHGQANYAAAKAGVQALTRVLSRECARRKIRVNAVAPGVIETGMAELIAPDVRVHMIQQIPYRRFGTPEEVADSVLFLCSPLAGYITGHVLEVDGGWRG